MARKRYQKGHIHLDGDFWKLRYRKDMLDPEGKVVRVHPEVILGHKRDLPTKRLAERRAKVFLAPINGLHYQAMRVATLDDFLMRWKSEILPRQQPSSARAVKSHLKCHIVPLLGRLHLEQLGTENQQIFISRVTEKGVGRKTLLNVFGTLSSILTTARDWGYSCQQIDVSKLHLPPRGPQREQPRLSADQMRRIIRLAEPPWNTLFAVLAMTGIRAGEALGLQRGDIDLTRQELTIRRSAWQGKLQATKTPRSDNVLPIPEPLVRILQDHLAALETKPDTLLFTTRNNRPPSSNKVVEYRLWTVLDALGIPRCGLKAFRHGHATALIDSGANFKVTQRQLRHSDARTTMQVYAHTVADSHRESVENVARVLAANGRPEGEPN